MIFDFRLRPPYKGFTELSIFNPVCNAVAPHDVNARRSESAHQKSFPLFLEEMKEAGIAKGVVMARATSSFASSVPNDDVLSLARIMHKKSGGFCCFLIDFSWLHHNLTTEPP